MGEENILNVKLCKWEDMLRVEHDQCAALELLPRSQMFALLSMLHSVGPVDALKILIESFAMVGAQDVQQCQFKEFATLLNGALGQEHPPPPERCLRALTTLLSQLDIDMD